ncbi:hypothetical protein AALP_AA7G258200 [Arabis alpina]|uniref:Protein SPT2 homolog n=1 Tax=Arabis alpina TaxID=50452 RepID=A0A087GKL5_ARAAL|nr:hypothetical protein AALP_AA7G258200 [Arabis alpina]
MLSCKESEFLELRQRIKESIRKSTQNVIDVVDTNPEQKKRKLPYNDFGSFFGPSQTVIAPRVLRESKPMIDNKVKAEKMLNSIESVCLKSTNPKEELKRKVEKLKDSRDYSFLLSDDAKLLVSIEEPISQNPAKPNPKPSSSGSHSRTDSSSNGQAKTKETHRKSSKLSPQRIDAVPRRKPLTSTKPMTCVPRQQGEVKQRKVSQEHALSPSSNSSKHRVISKPPLKQPQELKKKLKPKRRMSRDDELALEMVRKMCNTDRYKGRDFDDRDDPNMETSLADLIKEENRSAKLARKEDAEQLRLIEEENRRERAMKKKKQKLSY